MVVMSLSVPSSIQKQSAEILRCVRSSNLHFVVQETPFSLYITVRKKLVEGAKDTIENECSDDVDELTNPENENKSYKNLIHDLSLKLEKAKFELQEALAKNRDSFNKHNDLIEAHDRVEQDLTRTKAEHESLKLEIKETRKALKTKEKEVARLTNKVDDLEASVKNVNQERGEALNEKNKAIKVIGKLKDQISKHNNKTEQKDVKHENDNDANQNIPPYLSAQSCSLSSSPIAPPCTLPSSKQTRGSPSPSSTLPRSTPTRSPPGPQPCMPTSPHTPPGLPPPSRSGTGQPVQPAKTSASISADYILGINEIDLGPRVNDLSKM